MAFKPTEEVHHLSWRRLRKNSTRNAGGGLLIQHIWSPGTTNASTSFHSVVSFVAQSQDK